METERINNDDEAFLIYIFFIYRIARYAAGNWEDPKSYVYIYHSKNPALR